MVGRLGQEVAKREPFACPQQEAHLNLVRTTDLLQRRIDSAIFAPAGLSDTQYNVLRILRGAGESGLRCGEIGARLVARDPDITRLLDRLIARGLVRRTRDADDRRVVRAFITQEGLDLIAPLDAPLLAEHRTLLGGLDGEELTALIWLLERIRAHLASDETDGVTPPPGAEVSRDGSSASAFPALSKTPRASSRASSRGRTSTHHSKGVSP